jgi:hypothetical protein
VVFLADDPQRETGAPAWPVGEPMLVVVSEHAPASATSPAQGAQDVAQWRAAGSPRSSRDECARA